MSTPDTFTELLREEMSPEPDPRFAAEMDEWVARGFAARAPPARRDGVARPRGPRAAHAAGHGRRDVRDRRRGDRRPARGRQRPAGHDRPRRLRRRRLRDHRDRHALAAARALGPGDGGLRRRAGAAARRRASRPARRTAASSAPPS